MGSNIRLIVLDNCEKLGEEVANHLVKMNNLNENIVVPIKTDRFSNGEGKAKVLETIRGKDLYILSDVENYSTSYMLHGNLHYMGPDEHFQDIKRVILATSGHADKISVVMPLLYESRQHKKQGRESLDCANALQELERLNVNEIITFDVHDPNIVNSIPNTPFDNFFATHTILREFIKDKKVELNNIQVVSPDMGAMERARYCAEMLGCDVGIFYKRRDLSKIVNGKAPVVDHIYLGKEVKGKDIIIVDDMIASGGSILEVAEKLKEQGANKVYFISTFALFTEGIQKFEDAYNNKVLEKIYSTNLTYVDEKTKNKPWYKSVDCSLELATIIDTLNKKQSISPLFNGKEEILKKVKTLRNKNN